MIKNMKIGKRLISVFILVVFIVSIAGAVGLGLLIKMDKQYSEALVINGFAQGEIGNYNTYLTKDSAVVRDIIMLIDQADINESRAEFKEINKKTQEALKAVKVSCNTPAERALLDKIDAASPKYMEARDKAVALGLQNRNDEALQVFREEARPYLNECMAVGQELMDLNVQMGNDVSKDLSNQARTGNITIIVTIAMGFVVSILLAGFIARGIAKPMNEIEVAAKKMADGDYDVHIDYQSKDEVGSLAASMRRMMTNTNEIILDTVRGLEEIAKGNFDIEPQAQFVGVFKGIETALVKITTDLSYTISQIIISSDQVSGGANQVSDGAQALAQGATEQASSVQELSASINDVLTQIKENAANATMAGDVVNSVDKTIHTGNEHMIEMMSAMEEISASSTEISKIIKTIEDIAFQTNILALNAAVEAARAGAAGKGFAVVADEVRNLATKSSEAAKQTGVLIEDSVQSVENGVKIAMTTSHSLSEVVTGATEITILIAKISQASAEQADYISEINLGVEQISAVVQSNSATSEESAAASEELNGQANMMKQLVTKFKLKNSRGSIG